jgi:SAM-dependent methyltransferase
MDLTERREQQPDQARHPWEVVRSEFFVDVVDRHVGRDRPVTWLDVGAGDGWLGASIAGHLAPGSSMRCWDVNYDPLDLDELQRAHPDITFSAARPDRRFDVVSMLDVLEHIEDDRTVLEDIVDSLMEPGGLAVVSVPVHPRLFSRHDVALRHFRRYRPAECRDLLTASGLDIVDEGGLFWSLLPVRAAGVAAERVLGRLRHTPAPAGVGEWTAPAGVTKAVEFGLRTDVRVAAAARRRRLTVPGLSYWAVAVKR